MWWGMEGTLLVVSEKAMVMVVCGAAVMLHVAYNLVITTCYSCVLR